MFGLFLWAIVVLSGRHWCFLVNYQGDMNLGNKSSPTWIASGLAFQPLCGALCQPLMRQVVQMSSASGVNA